MTRPTGFLSLAVAAMLLAGCEDGIKNSEGDPLFGSTVPDLVDRPISPLSPAEIELFLRDSTLSYEGENRTWHIYIHEDGTLHGLSVTPDGGQERSRGVWNVNERGEMCRVWASDWGEGQKGCAKVYRFNTDYVFAPEGTEIEDGIRRSRSPGDPFKIL
ncbi:MAG: hypothetical protein AAFV86_04270 [Pseudomonadota bacterium]